MCRLRSIMLSMFPWLSRISAITTIKPKGRERVEMLKIMGISLP